MSNDLFSKARSFLKIVFRTSSSRRASKTLFGVENLRASTDFKTLSTRAINRTESIIRRIEVLESSKDGPTEILLAIDSISNEVCSVIDAAELCRNVHVDEEYRDQAEKAYEELYNFINQLNSNKVLYDKVVSITGNESLVDKLTAEESLFATDIQLEFVSGGIHLKGDKRAELMDVQSRILACETKFSQNISANNSPFLLGPLSTSQRDKLSSYLSNFLLQDVNWIKDELSKRPSTMPNPEPKPTSYAVCTSNKRICSNLMTHVPDEKTRQQIWEGSHLQPRDNIDVLGNLLKSRQELAKLLGYKSFAHKYLSNKVLQTPESVQELLKQTAVAVRPKAEAEMETLLKLKYDLERNKRSFTRGFIDNTPNVELKPWDINYLIAEHTKNTNQTRRKETASGSISEYLSLSSCLNSIIDISNSLFGIVMVEEKVGPEESWVSSSTGSDSVKKYVVYSDESRSEELGIVYFDLFHRENKFPSPAHFVVSCGTTNDYGEFVNRGSNRVFESEYRPRQQLPVIALVFNFTPGHRGMHMGLTEHTFLSLVELEVLYHEWGHALHSLLSRTTFQHLSGTRGSTDFVEVPSHLFEFFARSPKVLSSWARHYRTESPLPQALLEDALLERKTFSGLEVQNQLLFAAADQLAFGPDLGDLSCCSADEVYKRLLEGVIDLQRSLTVIPLAGSVAGSRGDKYYNPSSMCLLSHGHFTSYGGGYYSYLFAKMYAAQIWSIHLENDPLSRKTGVMLWKEFLHFGASRSPKSLLLDLAGDLDPKYFLENLEN